MRLMTWMTTTTGNATGPHSTMNSAARMQNRGHGEGGRQFCRFLFGTHHQREFAGAVERRSHQLICARDRRVRAVGIENIRTELSVGNPPTARYYLCRASREPGDVPGTVSDPGVCSGNEAFFEEYPGKRRIKANRVAPSRNGAQVTL